MAEDQEDVVADGIKKYKSARHSSKVLIIVGELDRVETPIDVEGRVTAVLRDAGADVKLAAIRYRALDTSGATWEAGHCVDLFYRWPLKIHNLSI